MLDSYYYQFESFKNAYFKYLSDFKEVELSLIVVLGTFAAEIGFKTMHEYRNRTKGKYNMKVSRESNPWITHSLRKLFNLQDEKDKNNLISKFKESYTHKDFSKLLSIFSKNNVEWRYFNEQDILKTNIHLLSDLINAIDLSIKQIDW